MAKKGAVTPIALSVPPPAQPLELAKSSIPVRLDLGCGQHVREGFDGVDLNAPNPKHRVDLFKFPWPFEDNSVDELHASHFVEHIPARDVELHDLARMDDRAAVERFVGQDMLFAFFDECWRLLKPGSRMKVIVPALQTVRAFQDPTHRRFIPMELFGYLNADWRKANGLDHYRVKCDFACNVTPTVMSEITAKHPEAQARLFREGWNCMFDLHADLVRRP